jgi:5-hydroxyisourate hydrolase
MGRLSTHVLDTAHGCPAAGMQVTLLRVQGDEAQVVKRVTLNADGRADGPLLEGAAMAAGTWRLSFEAADYFRALGLELPEPPFVGTVHLDFGMADVQGHYHVPLLVSPWSWSTYRGS